MKNTCFQIQILPNSLFILRRDEDGWEATFTSAKEAMDYADSLPGAEESQMTVFDDDGIRFLRVVC